MTVEDHADTASQKVTVSVIVPCFNEQSTIGLLLRAIYGQTYPRAMVEVIIADGMSTDSTRDEVTAFTADHPDLKVRLVDNPKRGTTAGLNKALAAATGKIIVRLDGHAVPNVDYMERSVAALADGRGDNVGGVWDIKPAGSGWIAHSIAVAAAHPIGAGGAYYRFGTMARIVDTVPFGAFHRDFLTAIRHPGPSSAGPYDETLLTNEDYELNVRIRLKGGHVWFDPQIRSIYFARPTLRSLAAQYWRYGKWKCRMLRHHPRSIRWRQILPPAFVLSLAVLGLLAPMSMIARWALILEAMTYLLVLAGTGVHLAIAKKKVSMLAGVPLALASMHLAWGCGFLFSVPVALLCRDNLQGDDVHSVTDK